MKRKKNVLGRGLDSLIPDMSRNTGENGNVSECDVDSIVPNPYQPRTIFSRKSLEELAASIQEQGIIQPLLVRRDGDGYELVAGERRLRAAKKAGLERVPIVIRELTDTEVLQISIIENIQREDLNPIEESEAYQRLMDEFQLTQEQISVRVGKSRSAVANLLRLQQLPDEIKESVRQNVLSMGHARALLGAANDMQQVKAWKMILAKELSVRQTEALIKKLKKESEREDETDPPKTSDAIYLEDLAQNLSGSLGRKVFIKKSGKKGSVVLEFYNDDDLEELIRLLGGG